MSKQQEVEQIMQAKLRPLTELGQICATAAMQMQEWLKRHQHDHDIRGLSGAVDVVFSSLSFVNNQARAVHDSIANPKAAMEREMRAAAGKGKVLVS